MYPFPIQDELVTRTNKRSVRRQKWRIGTKLAQMLKFLGFKQTPGCGCERRQRKLDNFGALLYFTFIRFWNDNSPLMKAANMVCRGCFGKARRRKALREERNKPLSLQEKGRQEAKNARRESPRKRVEVKNPMNTPPSVVYTYPNVN